MENGSIHLAIRTRTSGRAAKAKSGFAHDYWKNPYLLSRRLCRQAIVLGWRAERRPRHRTQVASAAVARLENLCRTVRQFALSVSPTLGAAYGLLNRTC
jgi:hypothetical protein